MESRLTKNAERKVRQQLLLTVIGAIIVLIVLIKYVLPFLININLALSGSKNASDTQTKTNIFVAVPFLTTTMTATNSATTNINGTAVKGETIKLFVNGSVVDTTPTKDDGSFVFKDVALDQGANVIKVKAKKGDSESDFSDQLTITYANKAPDLSIDSPSDHQSFPKDSDTISVKGKTSQDVKVTVNGFWAILDEKGNYSYVMHLHNGDNEIDVIATDAAGNKTEKKITVTYSQ